MKELYLPLMRRDIKAWKKWFSDKSHLSMEELKKETGSTEDKIKKIKAHLNKPCYKNI